MKTEVRVHRSLWSDDVEMLVLVTHGDGRMSVAKSLTLEPHEEGVLMQPTMRLDATAAQMLIDRLWDCGLRPTSEGSGPYCCHDMPLKDTPLNLLAEYVEELQEQIEMLKRQIEGMTGDGL